MNFIPEGGNGGGGSSGGGAGDYYGGGGGGGQAWGYNPHWHQQPQQPPQQVTYTVDKIVNKTGSWPLCLKTSTIVNDRIY